MERIKERVSGIWEAFVEGSDTLNKFSRSEIALPLHSSEPWSPKVGYWEDYFGGYF